MKKSIKVGSLLVMASVVVILSGLPAVAQENSPENMKILAEKMKADKKLIVAANMGLTETEAKAFWPVYQDYQDELFLLRQRTVKMINDYGTAYESMTNDTAKKLLEEFMTIEALGLKLRKAYVPKFQKVLPDIKVMRYYQIENKINAIIMYELATQIPLTELTTK